MSQQERSYNDELRYLLYQLEDRENIIKMRDLRKPEEAGMLAAIRTVKKFVKEEIKNGFTD